MSVIIPEKDFTEEPSFIIPNKDIIQSDGFSMPENDIIEPTVPIKEPSDAIVPVTSTNDQFDTSIGQYSKEYNVSSNLIKGLIQQESNFVTDAVSEVGAKGLGQFMPKTGAQYGLLSDAYFNDSNKNIKAVANYLDDLMSYYEKKGVKGDDIIKLSLGAYNGGHQKARYDLYKKYGSEWVSHLSEMRTKNKDYDFKQNEDYIKKVFGNFINYNKTNAPKVIEKEEVIPEVIEPVEDENLKAPDLTAVQDVTVVSTEIAQEEQIEAPREKAIVENIVQTGITSFKDATANFITALTSIGDKATSAEDAKLIQEQQDKAAMARRQSGRGGFTPSNIGQEFDNASLVVLNDLAKKIKESTPLSVRKEIEEASSGKLFSTDVGEMIETWSTTIAQQIPNLAAAATLPPPVTFAFMAAQEKENFKEQVRSSAKASGVELDEGELNERAVIKLAVASLKLVMPV